MCPDRPPRLETRCRWLRAAESRAARALEDFKRDFLKEHLGDLTPQERLEGLSPEQRLEGLSAEEIERILEKRKAERPSRSRKPRRK